MDVYQKQVFKYLYPLVILFTFFLFFRAHWAFSGLGFDESCYLEYVHRFVGLPYPQCYSHSHFPGISVLWIPFALLARVVALFSGSPVEPWLLPFTGMFSFLSWGLSLYLIALIWEEYRPRLEFFAASWVFPVVFLFSVPVLAYAVRNNHLPHSGELSVALFGAWMLVRRHYLLAAASILFLTSIRINDAPMILMFLGAIADSFQQGGKKIPQKYLRPLLICAGLAAAAVFGLMINIAFITGYHGILLTDILKNINVEGVERVLFTKHLGMAWFMPHWVLMFVLGAVLFRKLSWMARGAWVWMACVLAFHVGHAIWWGGHLQQIRYLVGTAAALLILTLELLPLLSVGVRRISYLALIFGACSLTLYNWFGADENMAGMLMDGSILLGDYTAMDGTTMSQFKRKVVLEPIGTSPLFFTLYSWAHSLPVFASFQSFSHYVLNGPPLWVLTLLTLANLLAIVYLLPRGVSVLFSRLLTRAPLFLDHRLDQTMETAAPFRYPIDSLKIARLKELKKEQGAAFPKVGILVVSYQASKLLVETLNRVPKSLLDIVEEIFVFDDFSQDDTFSLARDLSFSSEWRDKVKVYRNVRNLGYGGNQKVGFQYAIDKGMDYVILLHGDGQYAPEFLPDMIYEAVEKKKSVVFGSRMMDKWSAIRGGMPLYKWVGNTVLTHFENLILGLNLTEFHSGYRLYATSVLKHIPFAANTDDFHFDTQIIIQCRALGESPSEISIPTYYGDEICRVNGMQYAWNVCRSVLQYRLHQIRLIHESRYTVSTGVKYQLKSSPYSSHSQILNLVKAGSTVLDIGCGPGLLAKKLDAIGAKVDGIDAGEPGSVWEGIQSYQQKDLEHSSELSFHRKYDYVIMADVLEHVRNPLDLLQSVRPQLKTEGRLIASTGNIALWYMRLSLLLGRFNYGDKGILDRTHVHLYTFSTFKKLILEAGYQILSVRVTSLPFEVVFQSTGKSRVMKAIDAFYYVLARFIPTLFAYQIVIEAEVRQLESARGEGKVL